MSGSTLSSYKAAAATLMGPVIDLRPDGERQHDWQSDKDLGWELSNACHVIFPETPEVQFLVQKSKQRNWFYRSATSIMVNWTFSISARTSKGSKNVTFEC